MKNARRSEDINCKDFASIGIYVINRDAMVKLLTEEFPMANDFKNEVIPGAISSGLKVHLFEVF